LESRSQLERESKIETDYLRVRAYPFTKEVEDFVASHEILYVVEQNRDGQLLNLMKVDLDPANATKLHSVVYFGGLPLDARTVTEAIASHQGATK
jgi:2-oxoglutarate ferredoxin oxidoreductase subunit alpha